MKRFRLSMLEAALVRPSILGGGYLVGLAAYAARDAGSNERALGKQAATLAEVVTAHFNDDVVRMALAIGGAAFVVGAAIGTVAAALVRARDHLSRAESCSARQLALRSLPVTVCLHAWAFAYGMARMPSMYAERWYSRGGLSRVAQVLVTDTLHPAGVIALGCAFVLLYLFAPWKNLPLWRRRFARAFALSGATTLAALAAPLAAGSTASAVAPKPSSAAAKATSPTTANVHLSNHPNVIVLAVDSLRADRLGTRALPNLTALAARGTSFDRAYVTLPRTFPSWVTLLTGRDPQHHGIRSMFPRFEERRKDFDALPERLVDAGYRTAVVSDYAGDIFKRIDLGFVDVDTPTFDLPTLIRQRAIERETPLLPFLQTRAARAVFPVLRESNLAADPELLADDAIARLGQLSKSPDPFFLTVFFSTAHFPYASPDPWERKFTRPAYRGRFKYGKPVSLGDADGAAGAKNAPVDEADAAELRGLYDGAVASVDVAAERILDALAASTVGSDTIVVVTADHGETLFENGHGEGHGDHLFGDEGTHVPLIIVRPGAEHAGLHVAGVTRDVDLAPTLYALTGVTPPSDLDGHSLAEALDGAPLAPETAFAETELWFTRTIAGLAPELRLPYPPLDEMLGLDAEHGAELVLASRFARMTRMAKHRMARDDRWKLLYIPTREGALYRLYDTATDPAEVTDVASTHPAEVKRLRASLEQWMLEDASMTLRPDGFVVPRPGAAEAETAP